METSTYGTYLMHSTDSSVYESFIPIKTTPDIMSSRDSLEATTLSDDSQRYIPGIRQVDGGYEFTANYDLDYVKKIEALKDKDESWAIWLGAEGTGSAATPSGQYGKYKFKGMVDYSVSAHEVNAIREMTITIMPTETMTRDTTDDA